MSDFEIIKAYIDTSKTFIQYSSAGLALPAAFGRDLGLGGPVSNTSAVRLIIASWVCFLIAIISGALYQYVAVKFVEYNENPEDTHVCCLIRWLVTGRRPGDAYGVMVVAFWIGTVCVALYSYKALNMMP